MRMQNEVQTGGEVGMKGQDLIDWIHEVKAEQAEFVVQYRDGKEEFSGTGEPMLLFVKHGLRYELNGEFIRDTRTILL